jgi:predicted ATPase/DNA-binding SARP family transcriptional activator
LQVRQGERLITRFSTQKTGALLAYLAYRLQHGPVSREVLIELLWPECELDAGRARLSTALSSLRHQLEPPGVPRGAVMAADRASVRLKPAAVTTDVTEFEEALQHAERAHSSIEQEQSLLRALELYRGPLLSGYYEDWIPAEQERLAEQYVHVLRRLMAGAAEAGDLPRALDYGRRAVAAEPLREELHQDLMRLYAAGGQPSAALRQSQRLAQVLHEELGQTPTAATRQLVHQIEQQLESKAWRNQGVVGTEARKTREAGEEHAQTLQSLTPKSPIHSSRQSLPTGTVTFLLTEIEGCASARERVDETSQAAVAKGQAALQREFDRHAGRVAKSGKGFLLVAFERVVDAVACVVAGQQALAALAGSMDPAALRVRMALHTGDVELEEGRYRGLVLRYAERMLAAGHGGQVLCSETTATLLRRGDLAALSPDLQVRDLGVYRLGNLPETERLFQIEYGGSQRGEFPPLKAEPGCAGNLPPPFTAFFGRQAELARIRTLLMHHQIRLLTLTGPGGGGKTSLALEAARQMVPVYQGAVWLVPLADLIDPRLIPDAVRDALRLPRSPHLEPLEQVINTLSLQPTLLVLDNYEHLIEGAPVVRSLLEHVPALQCLVTSRRRLDLEGERELVVPPLPIPMGDATPERLSLCESVQLFIDRAQSVRPDFQITPSNATALAELCRRLEGIPLAIELAAARIQVLTPTQMLDQLASRFDFLVSRRRDATSRHRTLRAAIEWGYQLLAPELQRFFARLTVFRGGWTLDAAGAVCEAGGATDGGARSAGPGPGLSLDYLAQLCECSLLATEECLSGTRFRMLETLRDFGAEQLETEQRQALARRHAEYFLAVAEEAPPRIPGDGEREWLDRLEAELDNLRSALAWGLEHDPGAALRLAGALGPFWKARGYYSEGRALLSRALYRASEAPQKLGTQPLRWAGELALAQGEYAEAKRLLEEALDLSRALMDRPGMAGAGASLGFTAWAQGDYARARALAEESLLTWQQLGDDKEVAGVLRLLGVITALEGDPVLARSHFEKSLEIERRLENKPGIATALRQVGITDSINRGEPEAARIRFQESLAIHRELGDINETRFALIHLGHVAHQQCDYEQARALLLESLDICRRLGDKRLIVECLAGLVTLARDQGQPERAARLLGAAEAIRHSIGYAFWKLNDENLSIQVRALQEALGEALFKAAWEAGRAMTWREAVDAAILAGPPAR